MTRTLTTLLVALLVVSATATAPASAALFDDDTTETPPIVTVGTEGRPSYILELANGTDEQTLADWANASSRRTLLRFDNASDTATVAAPKQQIHPRTVFGFEMPTIGYTALSERSYVEGISPNYQLSIPDPVTLKNQSDVSGPPTIGLTDANDPEYPTEGVAYDGDANRTTMAEFRAVLGVDNVTANASGLVIAPIDTGTNTADGEVFGNGSTGSDIRILNASKNFITNETVDGSGYDAITDQNAHGTWVSSAIAANASGTTHDGMAPNASLLVLKALNGDGSGSTSNIAAAIRYAAGDNPSNTTADIISMSLGSPVYSPALANAIEYAYDNGVDAVVIAVGNSRQTTRWVATPADVNSTIAVGATTGDEPTSAESAYFSQVGPDPSTTDGEGLESAGAVVDVVAPGMKTVAKTPDTSGFVANKTLSGTSMSTPGVAGALALAFAANQSLHDLGHEQLHDTVREAARPVPHAGVTEAGAGMFAADTLADGTYPDTDQPDARTDPAQQRDTYNRGLSASSGGLLAQAAVARSGV